MKTENDIMIMGSDKQHVAMKVENLDTGYITKKGDISVVNAINFELEAGELTAIVGINGIGKSTLLRTLGKVQPGLSGSIEINGKRLENFKAVDLASQISLVLTEPMASKNMTVIELVALGRQPYTNWIGTLTTEDLQQINASLEMLELVVMKHKKCYELSDGQLQRVMIARAMAQDTSIIY